MIVRPPSSFATAMTLTADLRPTSPPLPGAILSNPDLTKLYMSTSCPKLKAESVISSDEEYDSGFSDNEATPYERYERFEPLETHDEDEVAFTMDAPEKSSCDEEVEDSPQLDVGSRVDGSKSTVPLISPSVSSLSSYSDMSSRRKLQWKFKGLTLWLELEEFNNDLTRAVEDLSSKHSSPFIPKPHTTAIYGMEHLPVHEAKERLRRVREVIPLWPAFSKPTGVTSDIAVCGRPGQVCSIAWSELTLASNPEHEDAMDALYRLFYADDSSAATGSTARSTADQGDDSSTSSSSSASSIPVRDRPWKPHNSIAYDNPETNTLSLLDTVQYMSQNPTLLGCERRVEAISLWSTEGKMEEWECLERVRFW